MKLWCSDGSPFARKVRIVLAEKGLPHEVDMRSGLRDPAAHQRLHPGLAVPVLEDGGRVLFESNLILEYLLVTYPGAPADAAAPPLASTMTRAEHHWEDAKILAVLETLGNTIANLKLMRDSGATPEEIPYLKRQQERVASCLDWLEERATPEGFVPGLFSIQDINFICPMAFAEKRDVVKLGERPRLAALMERFSSRASVAGTRPGDLQASAASLRAAR